MGASFRRRVQQLSEQLSGTAEAEEDSIERVYGERFRIASEVCQVRPRAGLGIERGKTREIADAALVPGERGDSSRNATDDVTRSRAFQSHSIRSLKGA